MLFNDHVIQLVVNKKAEIDQLRRDANQFDDQSDPIAEAKCKSLERQAQRPARRALAKQRRSHRLNLIDVGSAQIQSALVVKLAGEQKKLRRKKSARAAPKVDNAAKDAAGIESVEMNKNDFVKFVNENHCNRSGRVSASH